MKHIKLFEEFGFDDEFDDDEAAEYDDYHSTEKYPKREFDEPTEPKEPFKRKLTDEENKFMFRQFPEHSWSMVDADGFIILGGGESSMGVYYITEEDLANFMEEELND